MKYVTLYILTFMSLLAVAQERSFNYDFETKATLPGFKSFQTEYEIYENPDRSGMNQSLLVGRVVKIPGKSIGWSGISTKTPYKIDLSDGGYVRMKVYTSKVGSTVQVKFENDDFKHAAYSIAETSKADQWEELVFKFPNYDGKIYNKMAIVFDLFDVSNSVFFFDDIKWVDGLPSAN